MLFIKAHLLPAIVQQHQPNSSGMVLQTLKNHHHCNQPLLPAKARATTPVSSRALSRRFLRVCSVAQSFETATTTAATPAEPLVRHVDATDPAQLAPVDSSTAGEEEPVHQAEVPKDVLLEFEHKLEADVQSVGVTLTAGVCVCGDGGAAVLHATCLKLNYMLTLAAKQASKQQPF